MADDTLLLKYESINTSNVFNILTMIIMLYIDGFSVLLLCFHLATLRLPRRGAPRSGAA